MVKDKLTQSELDFFSMFSLNNTIEMPFLIEMAEEEIQHPDLRKRLGEIFSGLNSYADEVFRLFLKAFFEKEGR